MFEEIDKRFDEIIEIAKGNNLPLEIIQKAYIKAKELHGQQKRKDGSLYLTHPVEVAYILAELGYDENVISAGFLHDTLEDCEYSSQNLIADFNQEVFDLVDCVTAIDKNDYVFNKNNIFEDADFVKASAEEQTFKKLITLGKKHPNAFAIKFADRIHNLSTIEAFDYSKQLEKVRETEKWILPIAKILKSDYFYGTIKNSCFKITNKYREQGFLEDYKAYHEENQGYIDSLQSKLNSNPHLKIMIEPVRECDVFKNSTSRYGREGTNFFKKVENYNIFMIYDDNFQKNRDEVKKMLSDVDLLPVGHSAYGLSEEMCLQAEDNEKNKFNIFLFSQKDYQKFKLGSAERETLNKIDEDNVHDNGGEMMPVKTNSGETKYILKNSTALDFAFKLNPKVGLAFKYAVVNDSKTKIPPYAKLFEGDKVEIVTEKDENGGLKNNAKLRWLAYVNTEQAKRELIEYFEENCR